MQGRVQRLTRVLIRQRSAVELCDVLVRVLFPLLGHFQSLRLWDSWKPLVFRDIPLQKSFGLKDVMRITGLHKRANLMLLGSTALDVHDMHLASRYFERVPRTAWMTTLSSNITGKTEKYKRLNVKPEERIPASLGSPSCRGPGEGLLPLHQSFQ